MSLVADPNMRGGEGIPLLNAACCEDSTSLQILLDGGAGINITYNGWTALVWACEKILSWNAVLRRKVNSTILLHAEVVVKYKIVRPRH